jgi:hypothetical protein
VVVVKIKSNMIAIDNISIFTPMLTAITGE